MKDMLGDPAGLPFVVGAVTRLWMVEIGSTSGLGRPRHAT
jgi:hypothetical protein